MSSEHSVNSLNLDPSFTRRLSRNCAATLHIIGTTPAGYIVLGTGTKDDAIRAERWQLGHNKTVVRDGLSAEVANNHPAHLSPHTAVAKPGWHSSRALIVQIPAGITVIASLTSGSAAALEKAHLTAAADGRHWRSTIYSHVMDKSDSRGLLLRSIATFKFIKAALLIASGVGALRLATKDSFAKRGLSSRQVSPQSRQSLCRASPCTNDSGYIAATS